MPDYLGVTGTRYGMTEPQAAIAYEMLANLRINHDVLHHGCCVGADEQLVIKAHEFDYSIVAHPPINRAFFSQTAYNLSHLKLNPQEYLVRNRVIASNCHTLLACPKELGERNSGTGYTIQYARMTLGKFVIIVSPHGNIL